MSIELCPEPLLSSDAGAATLELDELDGLVLVEAVVDFEVLDEDELDEVLLVELDAVLDGEALEDAELTVCEAAGVLLVLAAELLDVAAGILDGAALLVSMGGEAHAPTE